MEFPTVTPSSPPSGQGTGYLIVQVTTARGAIPLENARVGIYSGDPAEKPETSGDLIASLLSGRDGNTPPVPLTAPPRAMSDQPGNAPPFAVYRVTVTLPGYFDLTYNSVPVFDGITAIQPAVMIPLPEGNGTNPYPQDTSISFNENTASDL